MITILAIGAAAVGAVFAYNKAKQKNPAKTEAVVVRVRQASSVVAAITEAFWAVLDALMFLTKPRGMGQGLSGGKPVFGRTVASDPAD